MIVEKMTDLELYKEVMKDYRSIGSFYESIKNNTAYKKRLQWSRPKNGQFVFRINDWKSPNGNLYTFIIKTSGWNEFKKGEFKSCTLLFFKRNNAQNAIRLIFDHDMNPGIEIFTSHFIDRYNQRFLKQPFLSRKEVVLQYMDRNQNAIIHDVESSKYDYSVMVASDDGYTFGKYEHQEILVDKTFVSRDMLFKGQTKITDLLDEAVNISKKGPKSNLSKFNEDLSNILGNERKIPTMDDLEEGIDLMNKQKEKEASLKYRGKEFDMELLDLQAAYFLWSSKFDWLKGQLKDEEGNIINHPLMKMLSEALSKRAGNFPSYI